MSVTTSYSVRTTRTVVHEADGSYEVTETTSGGDTFGGRSPADERADAKRSSALHSVGDSGGPRYTPGWGCRYANNSKSGSTSSAATMHGKSFAEIKAQCLREKKLFEDADFPALDSSIFYSRSPPRPFVWQRPSVS